MFYLFGGEQGLENTIRLPKKFFLCEFNAGIVKSKEKLNQDHFYINIGHKKDFLKKPWLAKFIIDPQTTYDYTKYLKSEAINLLSFDVGWPDF